MGFGTTVEAGLMMRQLLRRREYSAVLAAPPGLIPQWQDELETKFGLAFNSCGPRTRPRAGTWPDQ